MTKVVSLSIVRPSTLAGQLGAVCLEYGVLQTSHIQMK